MRASSGARMSLTSIHKGMTSLKGFVAMDTLADSKLFLTIVAVTLVFLFGSVPAVHADSGVIVYPFPEDLPSVFMSTDYSVTVNGIELPIYNGGKNAWDHGVSFGYFDMTERAEITI